MYSDVGSIPTRPAEIAQLLDEHHLAVVSGHPGTRTRFATSLAAELSAIADSEVVVLRGERMSDLMTFCGELERAMSAHQPVPPIERSVRGVIDALRADTGRIDTRPAKHQYLIWQDADILLEANIQLFGRLANAIMGVAAEREHITSDMLLLQRVIFVGGDKLGAYGEEQGGQFRTWLLEDGTTPFWEVISVVERPAVLTYRLDG